MKTVGDQSYPLAVLTRPDSELHPAPSSNDDMMERYYEDAIDDPAMNTQPIEVYLYYAAREREREAADTRAIPDAPWTAVVKGLPGKAKQKPKAKTAGRPGDDGAFPPSPGVPTTPGLWCAWPQSQSQSMSSATVASMQESTMKGSTETLTLRDKEAATVLEGEQPLITPAESQTAYRLLRVASWQVVFFLITTDVLGWYTAPMAFAQLGFGPSILVYTCFYLLAFCSGQILWRMYLALDSEKYPVKCYADLGQRTYGPIAKHVFNVLQSVQLLFNVAMFLIMDGQALAQLINFKFCYMALTVFFALFCMAFSQAKTLRSLSWFASINLWINMLVMILTMVGIGLYDPVPAQSGHADLSEPIRVSAWVPPTTQRWYQQVSGVQLAVFAYGGAMIFTEFMAEMRQPRDFWKAALGAQMFCWLLYMLFGIFVYALQGQYTAILPTINFSSRLFQGITNILGLVCVCIVAILYAHIGCKVFYRNILRGYFRAPSLSSPKSHMYWSATVCGYFLLAWVLGSAIPNIADLNTIVGAACILQFTYTFPPLLLVGHWVQKDASEGDIPWHPGLAAWSTRRDTWREAARWKRGFKKYWYAKVGLILMSLGCLALCVLGLYSGVMIASDSFAKGFTTSFSCRAPRQPLDI